MNAAATEPSVSQLSARIDDVILGMKWMFALFLIVISVPNLIAALTIPRFAMIFQDALPGKPLPLLTLFMIAHSGLLQLLALAWPIAGVTFIFREKRVRVWTVAAALIAGGIGLQLLLTQTALFMPMVGLITGMSNGPAN